MTVTTLDRLARFAQEVDVSDWNRDALDHIELHVLDSLGAMGAGAGTSDVEAIERMNLGSEAEGSIASGVAVARATEIDDIHLSSCTTPGSVIVPVALAMASSGKLSSRGAFLSAVAAGYEILVRVGLALDGPAILREGVWPTLFAAPLGSATVAARALELSTEATSGAMATALALSTGTSIRPRTEPSSRWLALGAAASNGALSAEGAAAGILGTRDLLEESRHRISGLFLSEEKLLDDLGERFEARQTGLKPYPVARQALAAVEACERLAEEARPRVAEIREIVIEVPARQKDVIDRPGIPESRMSSVVSVQYQAALAILAPEKLRDVRRKPPFVDDAVRDLASRVTVEAAADLERYYPAAWPGRAEIRFGSSRLRSEVIHPVGDVESESAFGIEEVLDKYRGTPGFERVEAFALRLRRENGGERGVYP